ncbi:hypothetical protein DFP73DRAFT_559517 [Morchella snyderi]|nr:hypothetical protein DFP73DRAFT_559517 [Morchella snyderi]
MDEVNSTLSSPSPEPAIIFEPPLFLQRRRAVHELLRQLSLSKIFGDEGLKSVLDVGCGTDLCLLRSLMPCDDDLPLEHVTGIDMDDDLLSQELIESLEPDHEDEEARWRALTVRLLHGSFEQLSLEIIPRHDIVISTEVIEHLDPIPLASYAPVLLGKMRPKVCIITTPNRDFNKVFDSALPLDPERRFFRPEIPYAMRHHDHRFEWTQAEFRAWAKQAAERFRYRVVFTGVGSLDCGAVCDDSRVRDFVMNCTDEFTGDPEDNYDAILTGSNSKLGDGLSDLFGEPLLTSSYLSRARKVLGPCSQIAIFILQNLESGSALDVAAFPQFWNALPTNDLMLVCQDAYPWVKDEMYPPPCFEMLAMMQATFPSFMPALVALAWEGIGKPVARPESRLNDRLEFYADYDIDNPPSAEVLQEWRLAKKRADCKEEERMEELTKELAGMNVDDVDAVRIIIPLREVWNRNWELQRAFRFHFDVFQGMLMTSGNLGIMELAAYMNEEHGKSDAKWRNIFTTPTSTVELKMSSPPGDRKAELVKVTVNGPKTSPTFIVTLPSALGIPRPLGEVPPPKDVSHQEEKESFQDEAPLQKETPLQEGSPLGGEVSIQEEASLQGKVSEDSVFENSHNYETDNLCRDSAESGSYCNSMCSEPAYDDQHNLHTIAVWAIDSNDMDEKSMDVEVEDEARMLKVPNGQVFGAMDGKVVLTFFKPNENDDIWGVPRPYETTGKPLVFDCSYGGGSPRWDHPPSDDERTENDSSWGPDGYSKSRDGWEC